MAIALSTFQNLLVPLQAVAAWLLSPTQPRQAAHRAVPCAVRSVRQPSRQRQPVRPIVRVVRVVEGCQRPAEAGRMVISGRMADVCAELDRLAALETAAG